MALATSFYAQRVASSVRSGAAIARVPTAGACCGPKLTETEFQTEADAALNACHDMIENSYWEEYVDDYDLSDGVLTIKLVNLPENYKNLKKATFVINKHNATKQIWYSSPCGAQYFDAPYEQALCEALETDLNELCQLDDSDDDEL
eukprot:g806.t1